MLLLNDNAERRKIYVNRRREQNHRLRGRYPPPLRQACPCCPRYPHGSPCRQSTRAASHGHRHWCRHCRMVAGGSYPLDASVSQWSQRTLLASRCVHLPDGSRGQRGNIQGVAVWRRQRSTCVAAHSPWLSCIPRWGYRDELCHPLPLAGVVSPAQRPQLGGGGPGDGGITRRLYWWLGSGCRFSQSTCLSLCAPLCVADRPVLAARHLVCSLGLAPQEKESFPWGSIL